MKMLSALCVLALLSANPFATAAAAETAPAAGKLTPSQQVDALIEKGYAAHDVTPNDVAPDSTMVESGVWFPKEVLHGKPSLSQKAQQNWSNSSLMRMPGKELILRDF